MWGVLHRFGDFDKSFHKTAPLKTLCPGTDRCVRGRTAVSARFAWDTVVRPRAGFERVRRKFL